MNKRPLWARPALSSAIAGISLVLSGASIAADYYGTDEAFASESVYFVVTDRFVNGDTSNDQRTQGQTTGLGTWDKQLCSNGTNIGYQGGDFKGIYNNADYIAEMGFTSVWITPIVDNPNESFTGGGALSCGQGVGADNGKTGYHGYWAHNFYQIDEHWPSEDLSFAQFNDKMETEFGLKTVLDIVANHGSPAYSMTHQQPNFGQLYDEQWNLLADHMNLNPSSLDSNNPMHQWYNHGGGLAQLSDLNENNPEVMDYLVGSYLKWINQGVDAFRIDTIAWMPHSFWKEMSDRIRAENPDFYMFGENFNFDAGTIAQHQKPENGAISVLDFPGKSAITGVFQNPNSNYSDITWYLDLGKETYTNPYDLATFYDNHDMARMSANGNSNAFIDANNWLFTTRGIPVVYYGSEMMFMNGLGEHSGNRNYYGENNINTARTTQTFASLKNIANIRKNAVALQKGVQINGTFSGQTAHLFRVYEKDGITQTALVMLNKGNNSASFDVSSLVSQGDWVDAQTGEVFANASSINTSVAGHSVKVLLLNAPTTNAQMLVKLMGPADKVTVSPIPLVQNELVTVTYNDGSANKSIDLHWGINNWAGAGTPAGDDAMSYNESLGQYEVTVTVPANATMFDFVFHNLTDSTWDANNGDDWHYAVEENTCNNCPPQTPTGLSANASNGQVSLSWSAVAGSDDYVVYFSTTGTPTSSSDSIVSNSNSLVHSNLTNGTTYSYAVAARNSDGESDLSAVKSATPVERGPESNLGENAEVRLTGIEFADWNAANTEYELNLVADNTWQTTVVVPIALTNTPYKLTLNGTWAVNWGGDASGVNASLSRNGGDATVSLSAGTYVLTVIEGASVNDALNVSWAASGTPDLSVTPELIDLGDIVLGESARATATASNVGGGTLSVTGASDSVSWMSASVSGSTITINVDTVGLMVGVTYDDFVTVESNGGSELVQVRFTVIEAPVDVTVDFTCHNGSTNSGQSVYAVGSVAELGSWNVVDAIKLNPANYPTWSASILLPASTSLTWKCIKRDEVNPNQDLVWQSGADNSITTPGTGTASTTGSF